MPYRCVTENGISGTVICVGMDENQSGSSYNSIGTWCSFTFDTIPTITSDILEYINGLSNLPSCFKVVDGSIVLRTLQELQG